MFRIWTCIGNGSRRSLEIGSTLDRLFGSINNNVHAARPSSWPLLLQVPLRVSENLKFSLTRRPLVVHSGCCANVSAKLSIQSLAVIVLCSNPQPLEFRSYQGRISLALQPPSCLHRSPRPPRPRLCFFTSKQIYSAGPVVSLFARCNYYLASPR